MLADLFKLAYYHYAFPAWPPVIVGTAILALGAAVVIREKGSQVGVAFGALALSAAVWLLSFGGIYSAIDPDKALAWARLEQVGVSFIPTALLMFTLVLTKQSNRWPWLPRAAIAASCLFSWGALYTGSFVSRLQYYPWGLYPQFGALGTVFLVYFISLTAVSLGVLRQAVLRMTEPEHRKRLKMLYVALSIGALGAIDFVACFGITVYPVGYLPVYAGILILAQEIWRYRFTDITPQFAAQQILETTPECLFVLDSAGTISLINRAACELLQHSESELVGRMMSAVIPHFPEPRMLEKLTEEKPGRDYELTFDRSATPRTLAFSISSIRDMTRRPIAFVCVAEDITERKAAEEALRQSEAHNRLVIETANDAFISVDPDGRIIDWNAQAELTFGWTKQEAVGRPFIDLVVPLERRRASWRGLRHLWTRAEGGVFRERGEFLALHRDSREFTAEIALWPVRQGESLTLNAFIRDISEKKRAEEALQRSEDRFRRLVDSNIIGFFLVGGNGRLLEANDAFLKMVGYTREDLRKGLIGGADMTPMEYAHVDQWMNERLKVASVCPPVEKEYIRKDGTRIPVLVGVVLLERVLSLSMCFVIDVSERRAAQDGLIKAYDQMEIMVQERTRELQREIEKRENAEEALRQLSITDPLTGLYNRRGFLALAERHLQTARKQHKTLFFFMCDLDRLKQINDACGHPEGDRSIMEAAKILKAAFKPSDVVARIGGDEFAVLAIEERTGEMEATAARIQTALYDFNAKQRLPYALGLSVGFVRAPASKTLTLEHLMRQADAVLYDNKRRKKPTDFLPPRIIRKRIV